MVSMYNDHMTNNMEFTTYQTSGKLDHPVTDLAAAIQYLDEPMAQFIKYQHDDLAELVAHIGWTLTDPASWRVTAVTVRPLSQDESDRLSSWISGQNSDGLGEGFEQQPFAEHYEKDVYGDIDEDTWCTSSFDWQTNDCKLTLVENVR